MKAIHNKRFAFLNGKGFSNPIPVQLHVKGEQKVVKTIVGMAILCLCSGSFGAIAISYLAPSSRPSNAKTPTTFASPVVPASPVASASPINTLSYPQPNIYVIGGPAQQPYNQESSVTAPRSSVNPSVLPSPVAIPTEKSRKRKT